MDESPVINESDDFVPLDLADALPDEPEARDDGASNVLEPTDEFVPMQTPAAPPVDPDFHMPTPNQVLHVSPDEKRLDTVPFEFADIRALAQRILKRAQEQGQAKLETARKQVAAMEKAASDKAYKEAFPKGQEEGFAQGEKEGMAAAQKKINDAIAAEKANIQKTNADTIKALKEIAAAYSAARDQLVAQAEGDLLMLALDLAKRLIGHELSIDPEAVKPLAIECIGLVTDRTSLTIRVNPEDKQVMDDYYPDLKTIFPDLGPLKILADPKVERGGIMAATREAEVDMRLATRLAAFEEVILGVSGEAAIPPWESIPQEAIAAAKAAGSESQFSLWDDSDEADASPRPEEETDADDAPDDAPVFEAPPETSAEESSGEEASIPQSDAPEEAASAGDVEDLARDLDDVADLTGLVDDPPPEG